MKLQVLGQRVLIKRDVPPKKLGLIELPPDAQQRERIGIAKGEVLQIGELCFKDTEMKDIQTVNGSITVTERVGKPWCKVGDRVLYQRHSGMRIPDPIVPDGYVEDLIIVLDKDVVAILEDVNNDG